MESAGCDTQVVAFAVTVNGDVTSAPLEGATTAISVVNAALVDTDGAEHPAIASATSRPVTLNMLRVLICSDGLLFSLTTGRVGSSRLELAGYIGIRTLPNSLAPDGMRAPNIRARSGCEKKAAVSAGDLPRASQARDVSLFLHGCVGQTHTHLPVETRLIS